MKAGTLRHLILIEAKTYEQSESGEAVESWETFVSLYASVEPLSGREYLAAKAIDNETSVRFRLRYYPGIEPSMRVRWNAKIFNILSVLNLDERNKELQIMCSEGINTG